MKTARTRKKAAYKPTAPKAPRKRGRKPQFGPESIDCIRRQERALTLRAFGMTWAAIADSLWPLDAEGEPVPGAKALYNSYQGAQSGYLRAIEGPRDEMAKQVLAEMMERNRLSLAGLMPKVMAGDTFALKALRDLHAELSTFFAIKVPDKLALTTPDGQKAAPIVDRDAALQQVMDGIARIAKRSREGGSALNALDGGVAGAKVPVEGVGPT